MSEEKLFTPEENTDDLTPNSEVVQSDPIYDVVENNENEVTEKNISGDDVTAEEANAEDVTGEESAAEDVTGEDAADEDVQGEDVTSEEKTVDEASEDDKATGEDTIEYIESPYKKHPYLKFGYDNDLEFISASDTLKYLQSCGFDNNYLTQARERVFESSLFEQLYNPHKENCRFCDFCGAELTGVEYEIISDGRERCNECSRTVLNSIEEFRDAFIEVRQNIENMFGIKILASIDVKTMDARKLARKLHIKFTPTPDFDGRVLGVAINEHGTYRLYVENQSPYLNAVATIAHELTHIWQYVNWDKKAIIKRYGKKMELCIYEGMAKWVEIQYLYFINEPERAYRELCATLMRDDEYGIGLKLYLAEYELSKGVNIDIKTPFYDVDVPLHEV